MTDQEAGHNGHAIRRSIVEAELRAIQFRAQIDEAVFNSKDEAGLLTALAQAPLGFKGIAAEAILSMSVRDRTPTKIAELQAELRRLEQLI